VKKPLDVRGAYLVGVLASFLFSDFVRWVSARAHDRSERWAVAAVAFLAVFLLIPLILDIVGKKSEDERLRVLAERIYCDRFVFGDTLNEKAPEVARKAVWFARALREALDDERRRG
jgi:hypothetical protein